MLHCGLHTHTQHGSDNILALQDRDHKLFLQYKIEEDNTTRYLHGSIEMKLLKPLLELCHEMIN